MADEDDPKAPTGDRTAEARADPPALGDDRAARARRGRLSKIFRLAATGMILVLAFLAATVVWAYYVTAPWTRDGRVRVQVASIAPQVSGQIVELRVSDNQSVKRGDVLYVIDPFDFEVTNCSSAEFWSRPSSPTRSARSQS